MSNFTHLKLWVAVGRGSETQLQVDKQCEPLREIYQIYIYKLCPHFFVDVVFIQTLLFVLLINKCSP